MKIGSSPIIKQKQDRIQSIVPGEFPQVEKDLEAFPYPTLDLLDRYGVKVAVLDHGESLADSPALRHLTDSEYASERQEAVRITLKAIRESPPRDLMTFAKKTTREFRKAGLDFHFGLASRALTPEQIALRQGISEENLSHWLEAFHHLNDMMPEGLYILPHIYDQGKPIPENRIRSARETTAEYVSGALGLNRPEDRLVLLHKDYVGAPAKELGNYRLSLHEMGHALDHVLDRMTGVPGFGTLHRQTVDALYQADLKRAEKAPLEEVFTTERASENVREYFAEAVEAYLTFENDNGHDHFREANSRTGLRQRNPQLHDYVAKVFHTNFPEGSEPGIPARPLLPEIVPDPDAAVILL